MTDFVLRSLDKAAMYAAFADLGLISQNEESEDVLRTQGLLDDGTAWCLVDQGARSYPTGETVDDEPVYATDEYWVPLRWNGDAPLPENQLGVAIVWRSDAEVLGEYPFGVTKFA